METLLIRTYRYFRDGKRDGWQEETQRIPVLTPVEARQGVISGRVFSVLTVSLALAAAAGAVLIARVWYPF